LSTEPIIEARAVEKSYPQPDGTRIQVVGLTDFSIEPGKIICLLGASGCGKSTLLRILSGLSKPSSGALFWHGKPLAEASPNVAIVFQSFALFPWLTVLENVEAPLEARAVAAVERRKRALRMLDTVGLDGFETAYPKELSGGMKPFPPSMFSPPKASAANCSNSGSTKRCPPTPSSSLPTILKKPSCSPTVS
jgi:NitT/TauT family transport system ATP-binding protein